MSDMEDLWRRAIACKHWQWMPGMLDLDGWRYLDYGVWASPDEEFVQYGNGDELPDFSDPATLGCLLALVREAWDDDGASVWFDWRADKWCWMAKGCAHGVWVPSAEDGYDTEAEALVKALEAAELEQIESIAKSAGV